MSTFLSNLSIFFELILNPACKNFTLFCKEPSTKTNFEKKVDGISEYFGQDIDLKVQVILFQIDCAIFYANLPVQELKKLGKFW